MSRAFPSFCILLACSSAPDMVVATVHLSFADSRACYRRTLVSGVCFQDGGKLFQKPPYPQTTSLGRNELPTYLCLNQLLPRELTVIIIDSNSFPWAGLTPTSPEAHSNADDRKLDKLVLLGNREMV